MLPAAFFAALRGNFDPKGTVEANSTVVNDALRGNMLKMSRGIAICLLIMQVFSITSMRFYLAYGDHLDTSALDSIYTIHQEKTLKNCVFTSFRLLQTF